MSTYRVIIPCTLCYRLLQVGRIRMNDWEHTSPKHPKSWEPQLLYAPSFPQAMIFMTIYICCQTPGLVLTCTVCSLTGSYRMSCLGCMAGMHGF
jgi:hypothetical protein